MRITISARAILINKNCIILRLAYHSPLEYVWENWHSFVNVKGGVHQSELILCSFVVSTKLHSPPRLFRSLPLQKQSETTTLPLCV